MNICRALTMSSTHSQLARVQNNDSSARLSSALLRHYVCLCPCACCMCPSIRTTLLLRSFGGLLGGGASGGGGGCTRAGATTAQAGTSCELCREQNFAAASSLTAWRQGASASFQHFLMGACCALPAKWCNGLPNALLSQFSGKTQRGEAGRVEALSSQARARVPHLYCTSFW